ncbi:MAG: hypothetical protein JRN15_15670 [Nitrososphaerota archaeon]|nr:hypothetical protein [Nitrososphaerota archaeon]
MAAHEGFPVTYRISELFDTLLVNTRKKRRELDLVALSEMFRAVEDDYKSRNKTRKDLADDLNLSSEMIREFLVVGSLPPEVQDLIRRREIDSVDAVREIGSIKDRQNQIKFSRAIRGLSSTDIRELKRMVNYGGFTPERARRVILEAKQRGAHVFVMMLDEDVYNSLVAEARRLDKDEVQLAQNIILEWFQRRKFDDVA